MSQYAPCLRSVSICFAGPMHHEPLQHDSYRPPGAFYGGQPPPRRWAAGPPSRFGGRPERRSPPPHWTGPVNPTTGSPIHERPVAVEGPRERAMGSWDPAGPPQRRLLAVGYVQRVGAHRPGRASCEPWSGMHTLHRLACQRAGMQGCRCHCLTSHPVSLQECAVLCLHSALRCVQHKDPHLMSSSRMLCTFWADCQRIYNVNACLTLLRLQRLLAEPKAQPHLNAV